MAFADTSANYTALTASQLLEGFTKCGGDGIKMNSQGFNSVVRYLEGLATAAGPDKFLVGLDSYIDATNSFVLNMSDGTQVTIPASALIADVLDEIVAAVDPDVSGTVRGWVNNVAGQELGGVNKKINGQDIGAAGISNSVLLGNGAGTGATGGYSVYIGLDAGDNNAAFAVTAVGGLAAQNNTGVNLTAFGVQAGYQNQAADSAIVGTYAGQNLTGSQHTLMGTRAAISATGDGMTGFGYVALEGNSGANATGIGNNAGRDNSAINLIALGAGTATTNTGANFIAIGHNAGVGNVFNNSVVIGTAGLATANDQIMLGNLSTVEVRSAATFFGAGFTIVSDSRNKDNQKDVDTQAAIELSRRLSFKEFDLMTSWAGLERASLAADRAKEDHAGRVSAAKADNEKGRKANKARKDGDESPEFVAQEMPNAAEMPTYERKLIAHQAGVIAQELREVTVSIGAFEWLVKEDEIGELSVDYPSLFSILHAGTNARLTQLEGALS